MTDATFEAFVRTHQDMVFGTAVRLLGNAAEAEDQAQLPHFRSPITEARPEAAYMILPLSCLETRQYL